MYKARMIMFEPSRKEENNINVCSARSQIEHLRDLTPGVISVLLMFLALTSFN